MNKVLIVRLGSLGDVIHAIPVAAALRVRYPHAHIDWAVDPRYVELLQRVECLDLRIPVDPRRMFGDAGLIPRLRDLRGARYDAVLDLQGLLKSAVLARAARGGKTIGFPRAHLREPMAQMFYTDTPDPGAAAHVIHKNLALLDPLDVSDRRIHFPIRIEQTPTVRSVAQRMGSGGYAILNPGAAWPNKRWPAPRFGALAAALHREAGLRSLVLWGPGEQGLATAVAGTSDGAAEVAPATTISDLIGIARGAALMVSGDTGPLHIAAAVGTPIVSLFGPTRAERNGPWSERDVVVARTSTCVCLYQRSCRRSTACIDDIPVEDVIVAVRRRLSAHV